MKPKQIKKDAEKPEHCHICRDVATGRHYGAIACNGCKGFFRRTIRRGYKYSCRFQNRCHLEKHNRAVCRYCRYQRCLESGMKVDQVQNERDIIGKRIKHEPNSKSEDYSPPESPNPNIEEFEHRLHKLVVSEGTMQKLQPIVMKQVADIEYATKRVANLSLDPRTATLNDVLISMHTQLMLVIEWAKTLQEFAELDPLDQKVLLKNFAGQHVTLCVAYRSIEGSDSLKLLNDRYIPRASTSDPSVRDGSDGFYLHDCEKVMDQLVAPMRFMKMDDTEFVALKACVFYNPLAKGLSNEASPKVLHLRRRIFASLEYYIKKFKPSETTRLGDLVFYILTPLSVLAQTISEDVMFAKISGKGRIDDLMEELILADSDYARLLRESSSPDHAKANSSSSLTPYTPQLESNPSYLANPESYSISNTDAKPNQFYTTNSQIQQPTVTMPAGVNHWNYPHYCTNYNLSNDVPSTSNGTSDGFDFPNIPF